MPNTRAGYGVSSLPNGSEYYRAALKWHLSEDMDPGTVHQMGKEGVQRITADMIKVQVPPKQNCRAEREVGWTTEGQISVFVLFFQ